MGRPRLPKGEAKGRIVPIRFNVDELKLIECGSQGESENRLGMDSRHAITTAMGAQ